MNPADREATARELVELLDRIDEAEEAIRQATKEAKERIGGLRSRARELRDLLAEKKGSQLPLAARVLEEAREGDKRRKGAGDGT
jgi:DNA repair exonuclease SbcCD ATPase subunit